MILLAGMAGWFVSTLCLIFTAFRERGRLAARPLLKWGTMLLAWYAVWIIGMLNA